MPYQARDIILPVMGPTVRGVVLVTLLFLTSLHGATVWAFPSPNSGDGPSADFSGQHDVRTELQNSLKLAQKLLKETRSLISVLKSEKLQGAKVDLTQNHEDFPRISVRNRDWLSLPVTERLQILGESFQVYSSYLDVISEHERSHHGFQVQRTFTNIRLDLRDFLHHIQLQMSMAGVPQRPRPNVPAHFLQNLGHWKTHIRTYLTLRNLEQCLCRAVRELTILRIAVPTPASMV